MPLSLILVITMVETRAIIGIGDRVHNRAAVTPPLAWVVRPRHLRHRAGVPLGLEVGVSGLEDGPGAAEDVVAAHEGEVLRLAVDPGVMVEPGDGAAAVADGDGAVRREEEV